MEWIHLRILKLENNTRVFEKCLPKQKTSGFFFKILGVSYYFCRGRIDGFTDIRAVSL